MKCGQICGLAVKRLCSPKFPNRHERVWVFAGSARRPLEIWHYIGIENYDPQAADRLLGDIENACETLARMPSLGHVRKDLTEDPEILFFCVRDYYLIIYRKGTAPLQIARVLLGSRDVENELSED
jgi:plasmid stabilization system protein ParE